MAPRHRRVIWTTQARVALDEAVAYLAARSLPAGRQLLADALEAGRSLETLSERGHLIHGTVREIFVQRYRLLYDVKDAEVQVLAFVHGSRDFGAWRRAGRPTGGGDV